MNLRLLAISPYCDSPTAFLRIHLLAIDSHILALCVSGGNTVTDQVFQSIV